VFSLHKSKSNKNTWKSFVLSANNPSVITSSNKNTSSEDILSAHLPTWTKQHVWWQYFSTARPAHYHTKKKWLQIRPQLEPVMEVRKYKRCRTRSGDVNCAAVQQTLNFFPKITHCSSIGDTQRNLYALNLQNWSIK